MTTGEAEAWVRRMVRETVGGYHPDLLRFDYTGPMADSYDALNKAACEALGERVYEIACDEHGLMMYDIEEPERRKIARDEEQMVLNIVHVARSLKLETRRELLKRLAEEQ